MTRTYLTNSAAAGLVNQTGAYSSDTPTSIVSVPQDQVTFVLHVASLDPNIVARFMLSQYVGSSSYTADPLWVGHVQGAVGASGYGASTDTGSAYLATGAGIGGDVIIRIPWYDIPGTSFQTANAKIRLDVLALSTVYIAGTTTGASVVNGVYYEAWIEY
jgi:hypothetical protein